MRTVDRIRMRAPVGRVLEAARNDASHGDYASALLRLNQIRALGLTSATSEVAQLTPQYQVGEAVRLTVAGDGPDAVALLDAAAAESASGQAAAAGALPAALLAAGQVEQADELIKDIGEIVDRVNYGLMMVVRTYIQRRGYAFRTEAES